MRTRIKLAGMGAMVLIAFVVAVGHDYAWHWFIFGALVFSFIGDAFLARVDALVRRVRDPFLSGMASFAVAQVLYCIGFWHSMQAMPVLHQRLPGHYFGQELLPAILPVYLLLGVLCWVWMVMRTDQPRLIKGATLAYCCVLSAMGGFACAAAFTGTAIIWPLIVGGLLFLVSDGMIAGHVFGGRIENERLYDNLVWLTYFPAQALLLLGASWLY